MANEALDAAIRELYPGGGTRAVRERAPDVSVKYIRKRAARLGVLHHAPPRAQGGEALDEKIRERYPMGGGRAVQEQFPEVEAAHIRSRANCLGVRYYSPRSESSAFDEAIRRLYPTGGSPAVQKEFPERALGSIRSRACRLGVNRTDMRAPSTPEEDEVVRRRYPTEGAAAVARDLGWPEDAVRAKATYLGAPSKKTARRGKLNEASVAIIKQRIQQGYGNGALAEEFGVSPTTISSIRTGRAWGHVQPAED